LAERLAQQVLVDFARNQSQQASARLPVQLWAQLAPPLVEQ